MTPMRYHFSGTDPQKVWARIWGSTCTFSEWASTTPEVPRLAMTSPGWMMPFPTAPQALSAPPPTTGVLGESPSFLAVSWVRSPEMSCDSVTVGNQEIGTPTLDNNSFDQRRFLTSK